MSESKLKLIGVLAAVVIHLVLALVLTQESIVKWLFAKPKVEDVAKEPEDTKAAFSFTITPKAEVQPEPIPETKVEEKISPKPTDPQFARTTDQQLAGKPKETRFFGERDTLAQSNAAADANAPERASVKGEKRDYANATASDYRDGSLEHERAGAPAIPPMPEEITRPPAPESDLQSAPEKSDGLVSAPDAGKPLAGSNLPLVDYLEAVKKLPSQVRTQEINDKIDLADTGKAKKGQQEEDKEVAKAEELPHPKKKHAQPSNKSSESGLSPLSKATEMVGSISRSGKISSGDVKGTPLGKYQQKVQKCDL